MTCRTIGVSVKHTLAGAILAVSGVVRANPGSDPECTVHVGYDVNTDLPGFYCDDPTGSICVPFTPTSQLSPAPVPLDRLKGSASTHFFGTDSLGRDIFSRIIYGSRISLLIGLSSVSISLT